VSWWLSGRAEGANFGLRLGGFHLGWIMRLFFEEQRDKIQPLMDSQRFFERAVPKFAPTLPIPIPGEGINLVLLCNAESLSFAIRLICVDAIVGLGF
jgi:hypothetical protein